MAISKYIKSLKECIIKKLGGYTATEYHALTVPMPAPIIKVETVDTEIIRVRVRGSDAWKYKDDNAVKKIISNKLSQRLGEKVFEHAKITQGYDLECGANVHEAEISIVTNRKVV